MVWKGVIIEESLEDTSLMELVKVVGIRQTFLQKEERKGVLHFHKVEVDDRDVNLFLARAPVAIKGGWYIHLCGGSRMVVVFRGHTFEFGEEEHAKLEAARRYGLSVGIIREQMDFEHLLKHPYD